jgi:hypothetical protein
MYFLKKDHFIAAKNVCNCTMVYLKKYAEVYYKNIDIIFQKPLLVYERFRVVFICRLECFMLYIFVVMKRSSLPTG